MSSKLYLFHKKRPTIVSRRFKDDRVKSHCDVIIFLSYVKRYQSKKKCLKLLYTAWIRPVLMSHYKYLKLIHQALNSPIFQVWEIDVAVCYYL